MLKLFYLVIYLIALTSQGLKCNTSFPFVKVNLLSRLHPRCPPRPSPPQLWPLLPSRSQGTPHSRTARSRRPSAQSGWPGSGRRVQSTRRSSPPATRRPWDREAFGPTGLAVVQVKLEAHPFLLLLVIPLFPSFKIFFCTYF